MTAVPFGPTQIPQIPLTTSSAPVFSGITIDATGEKAAFIFRVPKPGTLDLVEFPLGAISNSQSIRVSFQDIDPATGFPDETQDQFRDIAAPAASAWNIPGLMTSTGADGGVKRTVTAGDWLAVVIEFTSTIGNVIANYGPSLSSQLHTLPYCAQKVAAGPAWAMLSGAPMFALKYNDGTYDWIGGDALPVKTFTAHTYNNGTAGADEHALMFQFPFGVTAKGFWARIDLDGDVDIVLYDDTTVLQTASLDKEGRVTTTPGILYGFFPAPQVLLANTDYILSVKPTSATSIIAYSFDVNAVANLQAAPCGSNFRYASRIDAGAWTELTTRRMFVGLLVSAVDIPAGGAAGGMGGNFNRGFG